MSTTGVLSLGPNRVANTWADGCKGLGIAVLPPFINAEAPTLDDLLKCFATSADWIYFAGHHLGNELFSEHMSVRLKFEKDKVRRTAFEQASNDLAVFPTPITANWFMVGEKSLFHSSS